MKSNTDISKVWQRFDSIFCLNYASNIERRVITTKKFKKIGIIPNDNFFWSLNFKSPSEHILFDITKNLNANECQNLSEFNIMMGHYKMIKSAYEMGCKNALFLEDDNCFTKDTDALIATIDNSPDNFDVTVYAYIILGKNEKKIYTKSNDKIINEFFYDIDGENRQFIWGAGMYSLNRHAMKKFINIYESKSVVADFFYSSHHSENLKICRSVKNLAIQIDDSVATHKELNLGYTTMGCDLEDYDLCNTDSLIEPNNHL